MRTLSVKLPNALDAKLAAMAEQQRTSKSAVVRLALEALLDRNGRPRARSALALAKDLAGCVAGPEDLSVNPRHLVGFGRR